MRSSIAVIAMVCAPLSAHALEVKSEATVSRDFALLTGDFESQFLDGQLALGGGITMISDFHFQRYGAQALAQYRGEHLSAGLRGSFGPQQDRRGWATLDPHAELEYALARWQLRAEGGVLLRHVDALVHGAPTGIDQLQLHGELGAQLGDEWELAAEVLGSFYDPDLGRPRFRHAELGLAVSVGGRPERWALTARAARRVVSGFKVELGMGGVAYADLVGHAVTPMVALGVGPVKGFSVRASLELVVGVGSAAAEPVREIGALEIGFEK